MKSVDELISELIKSIEEKSFVQVRLGNYQGTELSLKSIHIKLIEIKNKAKLSFTYKYKTKDIVKNYSLDEAKLLLKSLSMFKGFHLTVLHTLQHDYILEITKKGVQSFKLKNPTFTSLPSLQHDQVKNRKISTSQKSYLHDLNVTDADGNVLKHAQDKYKQINHYIEILSKHLENLPPRDLYNIVDMGAGKGYLTFALYDYLCNVLNKNVNIVGVELRKELVDECNQIAEKSQFKNLSFVQGKIEDFEKKEIHILIALHACDTATDDAISFGIKCNADLIVVAPCCHKQIRKEIEKSQSKNDLDFMLKFGIFLERQSEMITDGMRAMLLEHFSYSTKVFEFISDAHTHKNSMIIGVKKQELSKDKKQEILVNIQKTKTYFGIEKHALEKLMFD